jgi:hypothetical protein
MRLPEVATVVALELRAGLAAEEESACEARRDPLACADAVDITDALAGRTPELHEGLLIHLPIPASLAGKQDYAGNDRDANHYQEHTEDHGWPSPCRSPARA